MLPAARTDEAGARMDVSKDPMLRSQSRPRAAGALPIVLCLALSGCGSSDEQAPGDRDASTVETKPELASGPEAGPETPWSPTNPQECAAASNVGPCDPGVPSATITRAPGGPLLASVTVTSGACQTNTCASGCEAIGVYSQAAAIGATCDLQATAIDGRTQSIRLTVVANPSPTYACCGSPQVLSPRQWVPLNPAIFSPSSVVVDFAALTLDGGAPVDSGTDGGTPHDVPFSE